MPTRLVARACRHASSAILLPTIASEAWRRRAAGPTLTNTDGHRLKLITAQVKVDDPATAAERLAAHRDFRTEEEGELTWWGRELTDMEQQSALAHVRAQFGDEDPINNPEETPRWLRGRLKRCNGGFEVEVNSEERLVWLLELLDGLGLKPSVGRRSAIDPPQDMPPIRLGGPMPFGTSQEAIDAWLAHRADERVPALGGVTPRAAANKKQLRPRVEAATRVRARRPPARTVGQAGTGHPPAARGSRHAAVVGRQTAQPLSARRSAAAARRV